MVKPVFIIAEAGVNHNGSLARALELVRVAAASGADAVKFQTFKAEALVSASAPMADYQKANTGEDGSQLAMLKALELSLSDFQEIANECERCGIEFMSTPFDEESADALASLGMQTWKIPSGEVTNLPLIQHIAAKPGRVILSTGMCDLEEVRQAVEAVCNSSPYAGGGGGSRSETEGVSSSPREGEVAPRSGDGGGNPGLTPLPDFVGTPPCKQGGELVILHCTSSYPAPFATLNLRAMKTLKDAFDVEVGLSDHSEGIEAAIAAVAMGATCIEKHFTLDRTLPGPDHKASLEPDELKIMVQSIRNVELALGDGVKQITDVERNTRDVARRSCVAAHNLDPDQILTREDIELRRPGTGIPPAELEKLIGKRVRRAMVQGTILTWGDVE